MNTKVSTDYPSPHEFYKSFLMIETKITTPNNTKDSDIFNLNGDQSLEGSSEVVW